MGCFMSDAYVRASSSPYTYQPLRSVDELCRCAYETVFENLPVPATVHRHRQFTRTSIWGMGVRAFLQADDDDAAYQMLQIAIQDLCLPIELYRVIDGEQALAFLRQCGAYEAAPRPDLVILDVNLPAKSGRDVLVEMREDQALSGIPAVIFTSLALNKEKTQLLELGAQEYLVKPPTYKAFLEVVRSLYRPFVIKQ